jgi:hypothetical protein
MASTDLTGLETVIAELRRLPEQKERILGALAQSVIEEAGKRIAAQQAPDGSAWPATRDGRKALRNAKRALTYKVSGSTVVVFLSGVEARHHFGAIRGAKGKSAEYARPILPGVQDKSVLSRAFRKSVAEGLDPQVWKENR